MHEPERRAWQLSLRSLIGMTLTAGALLYANCTPHFGTAYFPELRRWTPISNLPIVNPETLTARRPIFVGWPIKTVSGFEVLPTVSYSLGIRMADEGAYYFDVNQGPSDILIRSVHSDEGLYRYWTATIMNVVFGLFIIALIGVIMERLSKKKKSAIRT